MMAAHTFVIKATAHRRVLLPGVRVQSSAWFRSRTGDIDRPLHGSLSGFYDHRRDGAVGVQFKLRHPSLQ
jgi:hypothetical protein